MSNLNRVAVLSSPLPKLPTNEILKKYGMYIDKFTIGIEIEIAVEIDSVPEQALEAYLERITNIKKRNLVSPVERITEEEAKEAFMDDWESSISQDEYLSDILRYVREKAVFLLDSDAEPLYGDWISFADNPIPQYCAALTKEMDKLTSPSSPISVNEAVYLLVDQKELMQLMNPSKSEEIQKAFEEVGEYIDSECASRNIDKSFQYMVGMPVLPGDAEIKDIDNEEFVQHLVKYVVKQGMRHSDDKILVRDFKFRRMFGDNLETIKMLSRMYRNFNKHATSKTIGELGRHAVWIDQESADKADLSDTDSYILIENIRNIQELEKYVKYDTSYADNKYEEHNRDQREEAWKQHFRQLISQGRIKSRDNNDDDSDGEDNQPDLETMMQDADFKEKFAIHYVAQNYHKYIDTNFTASDTYHSTTDYTKFRIEPDSSIEPNGAEVVSAIFSNYKDALDWMEKVFHMIDDVDGLATNDSTGLHINVGGFDTDKFDVAKLLVLLNDREILKTFNREYSTYTLPVQKAFDKILDGIDDTNRKRPEKGDITTINNYLDYIQTLLKQEAEKYSSANLMKYTEFNVVEFRMAGGEDYHNRFSDIKRTLIQILRVCHIAQSNLFQKEYFKSIYRVMNKPEKTDYYNDSVTKHVSQHINRYNQASMQKHLLTKEYKDKYLNTYRLINLNVLSGGPLNEDEKDEESDKFLSHFVGLQLFELVNYTEDTTWVNTNLLFTDPPVNPISITLLKNLRAYFMSINKEQPLNLKTIINLYSTHWKLPVTKIPRFIYGDAQAFETVREIITHLGWYRKQFIKHHHIKDFYSGDGPFRTTTVMVMPDWLKFIISGKRKYLQSYLERSKIHPGNRYIKASLMTPSERVDIVLARRMKNSVRSIYWHGTTDKFLPQIMRYGLDPSKIKEGVWQGQKKIPKRASMESPSKNAYGGVYFAASMYTSYGYARDSARKLGGNPILIACVLSESSTVPDEDNYHIDDIFARITFKSVSRIADQLTRIVLKYDAGYWETASSYSKILEQFRIEVFQALEITQDKIKKREDQKRLIRIIDNIFIAACKRYLSYYSLAHGAKYHDSAEYYIKKAFRDWASPSMKEKYTAFALDNSPRIVIPPLLRIPSYDVAEEKYRKVMNEFIKLTRNEFSHYFKSNKKSDWEKASKTVRVLTPVGFKGRNRIVSILSIKQDNSERSYPIAIQYGKVPKSFLTQFKDRIDSHMDIKWFDKAGNLIAIKDELESRHIIEGSFTVEADETDYPSSGPITVGVQPYSAEQNKINDELGDRMEKAAEEKEQPKEKPKVKKKIAPPMDDEGEEEPKPKGKKKLQPPMEYEADGEEEAPKKKLKPPMDDEEDSVEASVKEPEDSIISAMWWVQRWVSGSMDDDEWEGSPESIAMGVEGAFEFLNKTVGIRKALTAKSLWRAIVVPKKDAQKIINSLTLGVNPKSKFQSFSVNQKIAEEFGKDGYASNANTSLILVQTKPDSKNIAVSMPDLLLSNNDTIKSWLMSLGYWHHQKEVVVKIDKALPLLSAKIIS